MTFASCQNCCGLRTHAVKKTLLFANALSYVPYTNNTNGNSQESQEAISIDINSNMSDQDASKDTVPTMIFVEDNEQEDHDPEQQRTWKVKKPISSSHKHRAQNLVLFCFFCAAFLTVIVVGAGAYILLDTNSRMKKNHDDSNNSEDSYEFPIDRIDDLIRFNNTFNPALPHRNIFNTTAP